MDNNLSNAQAVSFGSKELKDVIIWIVGVETNFVIDVETITMDAIVMVIIDLLI